MLDRITGIYYMQVEDLNSHQLPLYYNKQASELVSLLIIL